MKPVSPLLNLPRELRDVIIDDVLLGSYSPALEKLGKERRAEDDDRTRGLRWWRYPGDDMGARTLFLSPPNAFGLLLSNHQLHAETIQRLQALKPRYVFHIDVDSRGYTWPTWKNIPVLPSPIIDTLVVDVEVFETIDSFGDWGALWFGGMPSTSAGILDCLISMGLPPPEQGPLKTRYSVRTLELNFHNQPLHCSEQDLVRYPLEGIKSAQVVCGDVQRELKRFLSGRFGGKKSFQDATRIFERFGLIRFKVDGVANGEDLDVAALLHLHDPAADPPNCTLLGRCKFLRENSAWYTKITEKRKQAGLSVIETSNES